MLKVSNQKFDVFFRGDIAPGQAIGEVKERLAGLFKLEAAQVEQLFSGRPTAIRRNLDEAGAKKYEQALLKIGALAELRPVAVEGAPAPQAATATPVESPAAPVETSISLAPVGSDVLRPDERSNVEAVEVDVSALALEPGGGELLHEDEKKSVEATQVDTSHLEVLPPR
ncbi:MAG: hypothetical protein DRQ64_03645 [Gammaproteobacteria bacterium]|nr:MAG: hypothetical protein DRQ64_03645 [Gammaproteobacteria bacterium]